MADDVPPEVKRWRNIELLAVQEAISAEDLRRRIGQTAEVFVEGPSRKVHRLLTGRTRTNEIVHFPGPPSLAGSLVRVAICDATPLTLSGRLAPASNAGGPPCTPERSAV
jgi:tRNA-2-methylthio-N6-dimethylallyladenosine synthase